MRDSFAWHQFATDRSDESFRLLTIRAGSLDRTTLLGVSQWAIFWFALWSRTSSRILIGCIYSWELPLDSATDLRADSILAIAGASSSERCSC